MTKVDFEFFSKGKEVTLKIEKGISLKKLAEESLKTDVFIEVFDLFNKRISNGRFIKIRRFIWDNYDQYIADKIESIESYEYNNDIYVVEYLNDRIVAITKYSKI